MDEADYISETDNVNEADYTKEADYTNEAGCTNEDDYKAVLYDENTRRHIVSQCENC